LVEKFFVKGRHTNVSFSFFINCGKGEKMNFSKEAHVLYQNDQSLENFISKEYFALSSNIDKG
jgi:hypothetical protein